jgi:hypothetical protein
MATDKSTPTWVPWVAGAGAFGVLLALIWPRKASAAIQLPPYTPPSGPGTGTGTGTSGGTVLEEAEQAGMVFSPFSPEAIAHFKAAARAAGLPEDWGADGGLHNILTKESGGWVGRPNYQFGDISQLNKWRDWPQVWAAIRAGTWRSMLGGIITKPAAERAGIDLALVGRPYSAAPQGKQSSATGLGQLTQTNIKLKNTDGTFKYYPRGLDSIGVPLDEAIGMLKYIKDRYQTPSNAWAQYAKGREGY